MVPEFVSAVGRVRYDVYNVHTVDVHAIRAADVLRALVRGEHASRCQPHHVPIPLVWSRCF